MSARIPGLIALCAVLAACQSEAEAPAGAAGDVAAGELAAAEAAVETGPVAPGRDRIACALNGADAFSTACEVTRSKSDGALELTVMHPDGGFRRFAVLPDGRGIAVADGAQPAQSRFEDGIAEVAVGNDRYRFPATQIGDDAGS